MEKKQIIFSSLIALIYFTIGFIITFAQSQNFTNLSQTIITLFSVAGIIQLIVFFYNRDLEKKIYTNLLFGLLSIWISFLAINSYSSFIKILPSVISLYPLTLSVIYIIKYNDKKDKKNNIIALLLLMLTTVLMFKVFNFITIKLSGITLSALALLLINKTLNEKPTKKRKKKWKKN